jgi:hypothetical protein
MQLQPAFLDGPLKARRVFGRRSPKVVKERPVDLLDQMRLSK